MTALSAFALHFLLWLSPARPAGAAGHQQAARPREAAACTDWRVCRERALEAAARGEFETFHDLAWRAVQTGPAKDPQLMFLLARAQSLSGRPYDALVILQRLADELGVVHDVSNDDDFRRARAHPGWPAVEEALKRVGVGAADDIRGAPAAAATATIPPSPERLPSSTAHMRGASTPAPTPPLPPTAPLAAPVVAPARVTDVVRFSTQPFAAGGLAYDAVSGRFLFGDAHGRKLLVVGDGANHAVELVRSDSAGFFEIVALDIDARRGDLWVASSTRDSGDAAVHRLQLISGRPLRTLSVPETIGPATLVDLVVSPAGAVLVLESVGRQLLALPPGTTALEPVVKFDGDPTSLTVGRDESVAYVSHRDGLWRVDVRARSVASVGAPAGLDLSGFERIRAHDSGLVGVQVSPDGSRRIVRLTITPNGRAVSGATILDETIPTQEEPLVVTISGNDLAYLVRQPPRADNGLGALSGHAAEYSVRRVQLR